MSRRLLGLEVHLDERVYRPAEDSLLLADTLEPPSHGLALDVGTGTGLAALRLASEGASVVATDVNPVACRLAGRNARANGLDVRPVVTDVADGIEARFEAIACNPPYLPAGADNRGPLWRALEGGPDGTEVAGRFLDEAGRLLTPDGQAWLLVSDRQPLDGLRERAEDRGLDWAVREQQSVGRFERLQVVGLRREDGDHR